ncbi:MAG: hypothetical protein PWP20_1729 [Eubacteriaceae bacterium]|nr:hypothetical protein [Eubacteriaceae bacterium]
MKQNLGSSLASFGIKQAFSYLEGNPRKNMPQLIKWAEKFDWKGNYAKEIRGVKKSLSDPDNNWNILVNNFWNLDAGVRKKTFENFFVNGVFRARNKLDESRARYHCNVPWAILMDPTSACNLRCTGCWAADYGNKMNMSYETLDDIIRQGKELGTYFYIYSGGEPLIRKKDIIRLCEKHNDCMFLAFTNGTLIDEAFANEMLRVKNFIPAISLEGFEKETDSRRGEGTYKAVEKAMDILHDKKLLFGNSCTYTRTNTEIIGSEEYFDFMVMYQQIRKFRKSKPLFTLDFWNDGEYVNGCIAGGRNFLHINANGDIEPCAFIHYSDSNIHEKTLLEAYQSPMFMQYKQNQPFSENMLRPCPLLDHEYKLAEMVDKTAAKSTDLEHPEDVHDLCAKTVHAARTWKPVADELWRQTPASN